MACSSASRFGPLAIVVLGLGALASVDAEAACTDAAEPGVTWRRCQLDGQILTQIDLSGAQLRDSSLKRADLSGSDLSGVDAQRARFISARMVGANLEGAYLVRADMTSADMTDASLVGADLRFARLFRAILRDADLTDAQLNEADFLHADLSGATWTNGRTICAEGSIGRCNPSPASSVANGRAPATQ